MLYDNVITRKSFQTTFLFKYTTQYTRYRLQSLKRMYMCYLLPDFILTAGDIPVWKQHHKLCEAISQLIKAAGFLVHNICIFADMNFLNQCLSIPVEVFTSLSVYTQRGNGHTQINVMWFTYMPALGGQLRIFF